jgi:predicted metal-dependent hydrolase
MCVTLHSLWIPVDNSGAICGRTLSGPPTTRLLTCNTVAGVVLTKNSCRRNPPVEPPTAVSEALVRLSFVDPTVASSAVEVRRSRRRHRTVSAHREGATIVILVPASLTPAEESRWVTTMVERVTRAEQRRSLDEPELAARAAALSKRHLDGRARPRSVRWVTNQHARWGSCTPADASIRLSSRLQKMPAYVVDYVLLHELAHLLVAGHGQDFWALLVGYEQTERARGFLEGVSATAGLSLDSDGDTGRR